MDEEELLHYESEAGILERISSKRLLSMRAKMIANDDYDVSSIYQPFDGFTGFAIKPKQKN